METGIRVRKGERDLEDWADEERRKRMLGVRKERQYDKDKDFFYPIQVAQVE